MAARLHASRRAREELISLIEERLSTASGKDELDQAGDIIDCGRGAGRRSGDAIGRDYYELGRSSRRGCQPPITHAARRLCASSRPASCPTTAGRKTQCT
jgi:hypothetical protein